MYKSASVYEFQDYPQAVFKAIITLCCFSCEKMIIRNELFTRFADKNGTKPGIKYIFCTNCRPIQGGC